MIIMSSTCVYDLTLVISTYMYIIIYGVINSKKFFKRWCKSYVSFVVFFFFAAMHCIFFKIRNCAIFMYLLAIVFLWTLSDVEWVSFFAVCFIHLNKICINTIMFFCWAVVQTNNLDWLLILKIEEKKPCLIFTANTGFEESNDIVNKNISFSYIKSYIDIL